MENDEHYMARCIELAGLGAGFVAPNPMVGAVLVYKDTIIGEGYHQLYGKSHAEVNCINDAAARYKQAMDNKSFEDVLKESRIYVSLEPCAHYGKTPPCADLIIAKKIPEAIIGCRDPFKEVDGKGIEKLRAAGVNVRTGILEKECVVLNKRFFTFHTYRRPYIILKWAQSFDHKIAGDNSRVFITNDVTNRLVHKWRSEEAAIMVGTNTAMIDDPSLTNRLWSGNNPVRLILDMNLRLPASLQLFDGSVKTIIFNSAMHKEAGNITYFKIDKEMPIAKQVCDALYQLNIQSVLVEGGATLNQSFIDKGLWDEARVITNNDLTIGPGINAPVMNVSIASNSQEMIWSDTVRYYHNTKRL